MKIGQNAPADDVRVGQPYGQLQVGPETVDPDRHLGTTAKEKHFLFLKEKTGKELLLLLRRRAVQGQGKGAISRGGIGYTEQRQCFSREGSGDTKQRQCLTCEGSENMRQRQRRHDAKAVPYPQTQRDGENPAALVVLELNNIGPASSSSGARQTRHHRHRRDTSFLREGGRTV